MGNATRTERRPPQTIRLPLNVPESRFRGLRDAGIERGDLLRTVQLPELGRALRSGTCVRRPDRSPGTLRSRSSFARHTGLALMRRSRSESHGLRELALEPLDVLGADGSPSPPAVDAIFSRFFCRLRSRAELTTTAARRAELNSWVSSSGMPAPLGTRSANSANTLASSELALDPARAKPHLPLEWGCWDVAIPASALCTPPPASRVASRHDQLNRALQLSCVVKGWED